MGDVPWTPKTGTEGTKNGTTHPKHQNEGTENGTTLQKQEQEHICQNHPFTKPPFLEVPRVQSSISGAKSGTNPKHPANALRANSEFPGFVRLETPKPWKIKYIPSPEEFKNCATSSTVRTVSVFLEGAPSMKQSELVMTFLTLLGALLTFVSLDS